MSFWKKDQVATWARKNIPLTVETNVCIVKRNEAWNA